MAALIVKLKDVIHRETPRISQHVDVVDLNTTPGTAASYTVPAGVNHIRVTYTAGVLYANTSGTTAAAPSAAVTNGTGSFMVLLGDSYDVSPAQVISFQNDTAAWVMIECRQADSR